MALTEVNSLGIKDGEVKTADIAADAVTGAKIADDAIDSEHYTDGSIDTAHIADSQVTTAKIADDAVTLAKLATGTDGQIISWDASGNPVAIGPGNDGQVLTSTGAGSPPAFEDAAASVGGASGVDFNDSVKARWGTGNDLEIYVDSDCYILNSTGDMSIHNTGGTADDIIIRAQDDITLQCQNGDSGVSILGDAGVLLFYDHDKKFETTSAGATVTGNLEVTGTLPAMDDSDHYTGSHICLGTNAGKYTGSNYKICIGYHAGRYGTGRHNNVFIGVSAGEGNSDGTSSTGDSNVCIGDYAGQDLTSGSSNVCIGPNAGKDITTGGSNVVLGYGAANTANGMTGTVVCGPSSGYGLDESNYSVIIGHGASGETLQGDAADNQLFIARQGYGAQHEGTWIYGNSSGQCQQGGGSSSWSTGSDERFKDFLGKYSRGLAEINGLDVQNFKWKDQKDMPTMAFNNAGTYCGPQIDGKTRIGVGAQSCEKLIPEAVNKMEPMDLDKGGNHMLTLDNDPIFWAMVNAIQELSAKVTALENA